MQDSKRKSGILNTFETDMIDVVLLSQVYFESVGGGILFAMKNRVILMSSSFEYLFTTILVWTKVILVWSTD